MTATLLILGALQLAVGEPAGSGSFPSFISVSLIDLLAGVTLAILVIAILLRYGLQWKRSSPQNFFFGKLRRTLGTSFLIRIFFDELIQRVLLQRDIINNDRLRRFTHLCVFWGFLGLGVTTSLDYIYNEPGNYIPLFGGSLSPIRLLGNVSGIVMMLGLSIAIVRMIAIPKFRRGRTFWDIWFTIILFIVGVTGFFSEYLGDISYNANPNVPPAAAFNFSLSASPLIMVPYGIHMVAIGLLFLTAPVSAFSHALTSPSLRFVDRLGKIMTTKTNSPIDAHKASKERAIIDQIKKLYEGHKEDEGIENSTNSS